MARKYQTKKGKRAAPYRPKSRAKSAKKNTVKSKNEKLMKQMMKAFALAKGEEE